MSMSQRQLLHTLSFTMSEGAGNKPSEKCVCPSAHICTYQQVRGERIYEHTVHNVQSNKRLFLFLSREYRCFFFFFIW